MKVDITGKIISYDGTVIQDQSLPPLKKPTKPNEKMEFPPLSWQNVIHRATHGHIKDEPFPTTEETQRAFKITKRAFGNPKGLVLSPEDIKYLLDRICKIYPPVIYGLAKELFEGVDLAAIQPGEEGENNKEPAK